MSLTHVLPLQWVPAGQYFPLPGGHWSACAVATYVVPKAKMAIAILTLILIAILLIRHNVMRT